MRFAVCVCGDLRGFAHIAWALEQRLIAPTVRGGAQVDLFFHLWSDGSPLERDGVAAARSLPGAVSIVVEQTERRRNLTAATYGWHPDRRMHASGSFESFRSQWRKVSLCFADAFAHARQRAASGAAYYDAYVRTRADTLHLVEYDLSADHGRMLSLQPLVPGGAVASCSSSAPDALLRRAPVVDMKDWSKRKV